MIIPCDDPVSKGAQRFEIFTGAGKRRDWPPEVKASIVAECYAGNRGVGAVGLVPCLNVAARCAPILIGPPTGKRGFLSGFERNQAEAHVV